MDAATREVTPADVRWLDAASEPAVEGRCPACGAAGHHPPLLRVPSLAPPHAPLTLAACTACGSAFFDPPGITDFSDLNQLDEDFWRFYVEAGAGVWETIWPVLVARPASGRHRALLDVGCGFGYAVDFWQRTGRGDAVGVELADYGRIGAERLGIQIHGELLQQCAALRGRRFDIVYASEVVEHVPDPAGFVALLAERIAGDGVLVLTTPAVEFVQPQNHSLTLLAALSPGFHGFLLGERRFADLARSAGMAHVEVRRFGERQVLWASRAPLALDFDEQRMRAAYLEYMEDRCTLRDPASPVWQGFAYRLLRDYVNTGRYREAQRLSHALEAAIVAVYGPRAVDPDAVLAAIGECRSLTDFGRVAPYFVAQFFFYRAMLARSTQGDARALRGFGATVDIARALSRFSALSFLEAYALFWPALAQDAGARLAQGDLEAAANAFATIARESRRCVAENAFAVAAAEWVDTVVPRACEALFLQQRADLAALVFDAYRSDLERRAPGIDWTAPAVVESVLAGRTIEGAPADPVFALFFAGLLERGPHQGGSGDRLIALQSLASRVARLSSFHRERVAHYASIASGYLPPPERTPLFESSHTLVWPPRR